MVFESDLFECSYAVTSEYILRKILIFFYTPKDILSLDIKDRRFRLGGLVEPGSIFRSEDGLTTAFTIIDEHHKVLVTFTGLLPDLFREGQGIIAEGFLQDGIFVAEIVLAKHDERYMPANVAQNKDSL